MPVVGFEHGGIGVCLMLDVVSIKVKPLAGVNRVEM